MLQFTLSLQYGLEQKHMDSIKHNIANISWRNKFVDDFQEGTFSLLHSSLVSPFSPSLHAAFRVVMIPLT